MLGNSLIILKSFYENINIFEGFWFVELFFNILGLFFVDVLYLI